MDLFGKNAARIGEQGEMSRTHWGVVAVLGAATVVALGCLGSCLVRYRLAGTGNTAQPGPPTAVVNMATPRPPMPTPTPLWAEARVVNVVDYDTIEVEIGGQVYSLRYIGIDCPEFGSMGTSKLRKPTGSWSRAIPSAW